MLSEPIAEPRAALFRSSSVASTSRRVKHNLTRKRSLCLPTQPLNVPIPPSLLQSPFLNSPSSVFQRLVSAPCLPSEEDEQWLQDTVPLNADLPENNHYSHHRHHHHGRDSIKSVAALRPPTPGTIASSAGDSNGVGVGTTGVDAGQSPSLNIQASGNGMIVNGSGLSHFMLPSDAYNHSDDLVQTSFMHCAVCAACALCAANAGFSGSFAVPRIPSPAGIVSRGRSTDARVTVPMSPPLVHWRKASLSPMASPSARNISGTSIPLPDVIGCVGDTYESTGVATPLTTRNRHHPDLPCNTSVHADFGYFSAR